jgi:tripartite-type tricarboxylate transporter receptor subunit TctC
MASANRRKPSFIFKMAVWSAFVSAPCLMMSAQAQAQTPFYAGKTVTIVVGASAGGGYDIYARAIAPYLSQHLAGNPKVVVQNMPGGGGLTSVKYLDASAPKDGTVITLFNAGVITEALTNIAAAKVNLKSLNWIGSANRSFRICYFWHGSGIKTWADLDRDKAPTLGAIGVHSASYNDVAILKRLMHKNVRAILGYPGRSEVHLAIERGELDGECGSLEGLPEGWIRDKKINVVSRMSKAKSSEIPDDVPWMGDLVKAPEDLPVLRLLTAANELGRPFIASHQIPRERLDELRTAFQAALADKTFLAFAAKRKIAVSAVTGKEAQDIIAQAYDAPKSVAQRAMEVIQ